MPPVACQQATANAGWGSVPNPAAASLATPVAVSGPTVTTSLAGSTINAASTPDCCQLRPSPQQQRSGQLLQSGKQ